MCRECLKYGMLCFEKPTGWKSTLYAGSTEVVVWRAANLMRSPGLVISVSSKFSTWLRLSNFPNVCLLKLIVLSQAVYVLTVTVEEGQKTVDQSKSPPPAPVLPNSIHGKASPPPTVKSSTSLPKSSSTSSLTALPGTRPRRTAGRTLGTRNPVFQVLVLEQTMCYLCGLSCLNTGRNCIGTSNGRQSGP